MIPECPYVITLPEQIDADRKTDLGGWLRDNLKHRVWAVHTLSSINSWNPDPNIEVEEIKCRCIFAFENKDEALLFKLAWGGE